MCHTSPHISRAGADNIWIPYKVGQIDVRNGRCINFKFRHKIAGAAFAGVYVKGMRTDLSGAGVNISERTGLKVTNGAATGSASSGTIAAQGDLKADVFSARAVTAKLVVADFDYAGAGSNLSVVS